MQRPSYVGLPHSENGMGMGWGQRDRRGEGRVGEERGVLICPSHPSFLPIHLSFLSSHPSHPSSSTCPSRPSVLIHVTSHLFVLPACLSFSSVCPSNLSFLSICPSHPSILPIRPSFPV